MSGQIFISYRRSDSFGSAGRLYDRLVGHFAPEQIFMDVDAIGPGIDFVEAIEQAVSKCDILIAVIGARWLQTLGTTDQRRPHTSEDFVQLEIGTALKRNIRVIPVLVEGTTIPRAAELPDALKPLTRRNAYELSHARFNADAERLIQALEVALAQVQAQHLKEQEVNALRRVNKEVATPQIDASNVVPVHRPADDTAHGPQQLPTQPTTPEPASIDPDQVFFQCRACKRWAFWAHSNCKLIVRAAGIEFVDEDDDSYSFKIPVEKLKHATLTKPGGLLGSKQDLLVILEDGTKYEIGLDEGNKEKALSAIARTLEAR